MKTATPNVKKKLPLAEPYYLKKYLVEMAEKTITVFGVQTYAIEIGDTGVILWGILDQDKDSVFETFHEYIVHCRVVEKTRVVPKGIQGLVPYLEEGEGI